MTTPIEPIVQFANHGFLPFAGREADLRQIHSFCAGLDDAESLRIDLISGEAGIGKSRLFEEALPGIIMEGSCIVRAKLHADTVDSLVGLLADSLWRSETTQGILKKQPERSLTAVMQSIRRLAQLRRLVVVIEDIHLIAGKGAEEFASLVGGLADEPMGMLLSARPVALAVRGVIEPYLMQSSELHGLTNDAVQTIWVGLFGDHQSDDLLIERLRSKTAGNPLALRMALRTGIRTEPSDISVAANRVTLHLDRRMLERSLDASTRLLAEGMIAHLSEVEREWAAQLAWLGEMFSSQAAHVVHDDNGEALGILQVKGIVTESAITPQPIRGSGTEKLTSRPLVFTHTLLHQYFLEKRHFDIDPFWRILAMDAPLYSLLPFSYIEHDSTHLSCGTTLFLKGLKSYASIIEGILRSFNADIGLDLLQAFDKASERLAAGSDGDVKLELQLLMLRLQHLAFRYKGLSDTESRREEYLPLLNRYIKIVEDFLPTHLLSYRINALACAWLYESKTHNNADLTLWARIKEIPDTNPELLYSRALLGAMSGILHEAYRITDNNIRNGGAETVLADIVRIVDQISTDCSTEIVETLRTQIYPQLMQQCYTSGDYERCMAQFNEVLHYGNRDDQLLNLHLVNFAVELGNIEEALPLALAYLQRDAVSGSPSIDTHKYVDWFIILAATNAPVTEFATYIDVFEKRIRHRISPHYWSTLMNVVRHLTILRSETESERMISELLGTPDLEAYFFAELHHHHVHLTIENNSEHLQQLLISHKRAGNLAFVELCPNKGLVADLAQYVFGVDEHTISETDLEESARSYLHDQFIGMSPFTDFLTLLILLTYAENKGICDLSMRLRPEIRSAMFRMMNWLIETKRIAFAAFFPEQFPHYFEGKELAEWIQRIEYELDEQNRRLRPVMERANQKVQVSMLAKVAYKRGNDGESQGIKGIRLKQVLGLMSLNAILAKPLSRAEFFSVVADETSDEETRRNAVKVAVYQLRKLLGHNSILQGAEMPYLNLDVVQVDLIEAHNAVAKAESEFSQGSLKNAATQLFKALYLLNGEVAFPTLYDAVFESAREDLDVRLRKVILHTCGGLLREGDEETCEAILRRAVRQITGDEELETMLLHVLQLEQKQMEVVRMKLVPSVDEVSTL